MDYRNSPVIRNLQIYAESLNKLAETSSETMSYDSNEGLFYNSMFSSLNSNFSDLSKSVSSLFIQHTSTKQTKTQKNLHDFASKIHALPNQIQSSKLSQAEWMELIDVIAKVSRAITGAQEFDLQSNELRQELSLFQDFIENFETHLEKHLSDEHTKDERFYLYPQPEFTLEEAEDEFYSIVPYTGRDKEKRKEIEKAPLKNEEKEVAKEEKFTARVHLTSIKEQAVIKKLNETSWEIQYGPFNMIESNGQISVFVENQKSSYKKWCRSNNTLFVVSKNVKKPSIVMVDLLTLQIRSFDLEFKKNNRIFALTYENSKLYMYSMDEKIRIFDFSSDIPKLIEERQLSLTCQDQPSAFILDYEMNSYFRLLVVENVYSLYIHRPSESLPDPENGSISYRPSCRIAVFTKDFERISAWDPAQGEWNILTKNYVITFNRGGLSYSIYSLQHQLLKTVNLPSPFFEISNTSRLDNMITVDYTQFPSETIDLEEVLDFL